MRFLLPDEITSKANDIIESFMEEYKETETGMMYYKLKEDKDVIDAETETVESNGRAESGQYYTLCLVVDPLKNDPPIFPSKDHAKNEELIETLIDISEDTIKSGKGLDGQLSSWVKVFYEVLTQYCSEQPTFFELRPLIFKD